MSPMRQDLGQPSTTPESNYFRPPDLANCWNSIPNPAMGCTVREWRRLGWRRLCWAAHVHMLTIDAIYRNMSIWQPITFSTIGIMNYYGMILLWFLNNGNRNDEKVVWQFRFTPFELRVSSYSLGSGPSSAVHLTVTIPTTLTSKFLPSIGPICPQVGCCLTRPQVRYNSRLLEPLNMLFGCLG